MPLINRIRNEIVGMGMEPERLYKAMKRFKQLGDRGESTWRVPTYQVLKRHAAMVINPTPSLPAAGQLDGVAVRYAIRGRCCVRSRAGSRNSPTSLRRKGIGMPNHIYSTLIVGAGFTGLGAAIKLAEAGVNDVVILERAEQRRRNVA